MAEQKESEKKEISSNLMRELTREVARAQRLHVPLSVALFSVPSAAGADDARSRTADLATKRCWDLIVEELRQFDLCALNDEGAIVVVLPNTDLEGANAFRARVSEKVNAVLRENVGDECDACSDLYLNGESAQQFLERAVHLLKCGDVLAERERIGELCLKSGAILSFDETMSPREALAVNGGSVACSFCGDALPYVGKLIAGPGLTICKGCIERCQNLLKPAR